MAAPAQEPSPTRSRARSPGESTAVDDYRKNVCRPSGRAFKKSFFIGLSAAEHAPEPGEPALAVRTAVGDALATPHLAAPAAADHSGGAATTQQRADQGHHQKQNPEAQDERLQG